MFEIVLLLQNFASEKDEYLYLIKVDNQNKISTKAHFRSMSNIRPSTQLFGTISHCGRPETIQF